MVHVLLKVIILSSFIASLFGGQAPIVIFAEITTGAQELYYVNQKIIEECNKYGMSVKLNSPCFRGCSYSSEDSKVSFDNKSFDQYATMIGNQVDINKIKQENKQYIDTSEIFNSLRNVKSIRAIPWACFVSETEGTLHFKKRGEEIFSFKRLIEREEVVFVVKSGVNFDGKDPNDYIKSFKENVRYLGDEQEGVEAQIITKTNGIKGHGLNGHFTQEELLSKKISSQETAEQNISTFFSLKKIAFISISIIVLYVLCENFYNGTDSIKIL